MKIHVPVDEANSTRILANATIFRRLTFGIKLWELRLIRVVFFIMTC